MPIRRNEFRGNEEDLEQFQRLASSPVRSPERESALRTWEDYKRHREIEHLRSAMKGRLVKAAVRGQVVDLSGASFVDCCVGFANMRHVRLDDVQFTRDVGWLALRGCDFTGASMRRIGLVEAVLSGARLTGVDLQGAHLEGADLTGVDLAGADLTGAHLNGANLRAVNLVGANLCGADLSDCMVYGTSVWDIAVDNSTVQQSLIITQDGVTVDDLKVAQFIYLLLDNADIRDVIDTVTSKTVLILGRFSPQRKVVLDAVRDEVRRRQYIPMVFDFEKPTSRGYGETVTLLARMARFVIADLTDAAEIRSELRQFVPDLPSLPVQPILAAGATEYATFSTDIQRYPWVLPVFRYKSQADLVGRISDRVVEPAEARWRELNRRD